MIRRPPRSTLFPLHDALPISLAYVSQHFQSPDASVLVALYFIILQFVIITALALFFSSLDRKSTRLNSSHQIISYAVFCLKKKKQPLITNTSDWPTRPGVLLS